MVNKKFFPYDNFRINQEFIIDELDKSIKEKEIVGMRAPCGFGKTISGLTASLQNHKKVILITPNTTTKEATIKEVLMLNNNKGHNYYMVNYQFHFRKFYCYR